MDMAVAPGFSTGMPIARAGIDIALHDLTGKLTKKPLHALWGLPKGEALTLSWTVNARTLDEVAGIMDAGKVLGYENFNIKVAPDPNFDVALAQAVRKGAPNGFLWADANGGYEPETALTAAPRLADAGVDNEGVVSPIDLEEFIKLGMLDGVAMKPARCGGLLSNKRQIELIQEHDLMWVGSGLTDPDISLAATLALYGAFGLKKPAALNGPQFLTADVLKKPLRIENGKAHIPDGPGLGIDVDEDKVRALAEASKS
jgi:muconate cycloisomerase